MNPNNQLIWREVKVISGSTQAVCEHFRNGTTRCYLRGRNGGKSIDLEAFRQTQPSSLEEKNHWFRELYGEDGACTIEPLTQNTPDSFFTQKAVTTDNTKKPAPPFEPEKKKFNWWKWLLIFWALATIGRVLSPSSGLSKKIQEAEREADAVLQQQK